MPVSYVVDTAALSPYRWHLVCSRTQRLCIAEDASFCPYTSLMYGFVCGLQAQQAAAINDVDILNFALNLEYIEVPRPALMRSDR